MSGLWSQCPWGKPRPYGENRTRVQPTTPFMNPAAGEKAGHIGPALRREPMPSVTILPFILSTAGQSGRFMKRPYNENRCL